MSEFSDIGSRFSELAEKTFTEINDVTAAFKKAEETRRETPMKTGVLIPAEYQAKAARAEADYQNAKAALDNMRRTLPNETEKQIESMRRDLADAINNAYSVRPEDIDHDVLTLIESGILRPNEYSRLMNGAKNATMKRLIAKHASSAAVAAEKSGDIEGAKILRVVANQGIRYDGHEKTEAFNALTDIFRRTLNNNAMIPHWPSLSTPLIDVFCRL